MYASTPYHSFVNPLLKLTNDRKIRCRILVGYFESKIKCLMDPKLTPRLALLACWDVKIERGDIISERGRKKFLKKSIKYYKQQIKNIKKIEKKI